MSEGLLKNLDSETMKLQKTQESHLDLISKGLGDIYDISTTMGDELERQNGHIDQISHKADNANEKIRRNNRRMDQMLN